jgi:nicotinamide mononucleotide adenylyltransferase
MKRALFIGRWQPLHPGHQWLFNQKLEQGIPILIAVRDTPVNDSNPFATEDVIANLEKEYSEEVESGMVKVISIPDIESVNYGRGVGYEINEFVPPSNIGKISATKIREKLKKDE